MVAFPAVFFFIRPPSGSSGSADRSAAAPSEGLSAADAMRSPTFWLLLIAFCLTGGAVAGFVPHLGAVVTERGFRPALAATCLSALGTGQFVTRFMTSYMLDRWRTPQVGQLWFGAGGLAFAILMLANGPSLFLLASILLGAGVGAELELLAYFVSRFFGLRAFGQIYGLLFAGFMFGLSLGPLLMAFLYDRYGNYHSALAAAVGAVLGAGLALAFCGPYRYVGARD
jgi:predicted MFS family arabinose efflux permease